MTVCLAAILYPSQTIAFVSDQMISFGDVTTQEGIQKIAPLDDAGRWYAMFAGSMPRFQPLIREIRKHLGEPSSPISVERIAAACAAGYDIGIEQMANNQLRSTGFTRESFMESGQSLLPDCVFQSTWNEIKSMSLGVELLVGGFDEKSDAQLLRVSENGEVEELTSIAYSVIGYGRDAASAVLNALPDRWHWNGVESGVYNLCVAKFTAERPPFVGKRTSVLTIQHTSRAAFMVGNEIEDIRKIWEHQQIHPPETALSTIRANLISREERFKRDGS